MTQPGLIQFENSMKFESSDAIRDAILAKYKTAKGVDEKFYQYVTDAATCMRMRYYKLKNIETDEEIMKAIGQENVKKDEDGEEITDPMQDYEDVSFADLGNAVEAVVINILKYGGVVKGEQVNFKSMTFKVSGRADVIIEFEGQEYILDVKSRGRFTFYSKNSWKCKECGTKRYWSGGCSNCGDKSRPEKIIEYFGAEHRPSFSDYCQVQVYMMLSNGLYKKAILWYYCKDNGKQKVYVVEPDVQLWEKLKEDFATVNKCVRKGIVPPIPFDIESVFEGETSIKLPYDCKYCKFQNVCWSSEFETRRPKLFETLLASGFYERMLIGREEAE